MTPVVLPTCKKSTLLTVSLLALKKLGIEICDCVQQKKKKALNIILHISPISKTQEGCFCNKVATEESTKRALKL